MDRRCGLCAFCCDQGELYDARFQCRRRPPTKPPGYLDRWPKVEPEDWCGEFAPKGEADTSPRGAGLGVEDGGG
jgi:hypothetical protein